jgi:hypothetical protein
VELIDESAGNVATRVIDHGSLAPTEGWTNSGIVSLDPGALTRGHTYHFRIISRFVYGVEALEGGSADYDDIALVAARVEGDDDDDDGNGGNGGNGGNKPGGNNAVFDGRNLFIKLKCFGEQGDNGKCFTRATALKTKGGKRFTFPIQRVVKAKKGKVIRARVRFQFRSELEQTKSIVLKSVLRTDRDDKSKTTKFKTLKLIDRSPD